jgi:hypothetical protein
MTQRGWTATQKRHLIIENAKAPSFLLPRIFAGETFYEGCQVAVVFFKPPGAFFVE